MRCLWLCTVVVGMFLGFSLGSSAALGQDDKKPDDKKPPEKEKKILEKTISEWIKILRTHENPKWRAGAIKVLDVADAATTTALPAILDAAEKDKDVMVRAEAVRMIGTFSPMIRPALKALVNALQNDKDGAVREVAATALGNTKFKDVAVEYVNEIAGALKDPHEGTRIAASATLRNMGEAARPAVAALLTAARDPKEHLQVRLAAVHVVSRHGKDSPQTLLLLIDLAGNTENAASLREIALDGLGRSGSDAAEVLKVLGSILGEKNVELRRASAIALGSLGEKSKNAWPAIKPRLADLKEDSSVRNHLIRLTGVLGKTNAETIDVLLTVAQKDESTENRIAAIQELGELGPLAKSAVKTLSAIAQQDGRAAVREAAAKAVKGINAP